MRTKWIISTFTATLLIFGLFLWQSCNKKTAQCPLCERDVHSHMAVAITHNSFPLRTCCMACALTYKVQVKNVKIVAATDFLTDTPIDPAKATYVVGSDVSPCTQDLKVKKFIREPHETLYACYDRCEPGILAFSKPGDAAAFEREHGGAIKRFDQLLMMLPIKGGHNHDQQNH